MTIPTSVGRVALALFALSLLSFQVSNSILEGKWICTDKSGNMDTDVSYEVKCAGSVQFKSNSLIVSDCYDGFFPSGAHWESLDDQLILRDSDERIFATFTIRQLDRDDLVLVRNNTVYRFKRAD